MDLDTLITLAILLLFFVFPAVLKKLVPKNKESRPSFFGKIGDQIQKFVQELEQQGQQQTQTEPQNVWDMFEEDSEPLMDEKLPLPRLTPEKRSLRTSETVMLSKKREVPLTLTKGKTSSAINMSIKANPLQNAIVWSEILASPLALRNK